MEEANMCGGGVDNLEADARLPPRKRLLAGMKKHNCDGSSPSSSPIISVSSDVSSRLRDLFNCTDGADISTEEIVDASRSAAIAAAEVAAAARAAAEEKAGVAAKAVAAAKSALNLVALFSAKRVRKDRGLRKDKTMKHVPVKMLYKKRKRGEKDETDEELARKLHRVINSSPRISKNSSSSDPKAHTHKKLRKRLILENTAESNGELPLEGKLPSTCDITAEAGNKVLGENVHALEDKPSESTKTDNSRIDSLPANGEAEANHSKGPFGEDTVSTGRKRGRIKQKKLSLTLCTVRDLENAKEEPKSRGIQLKKGPKGKSTPTEEPLLSVEPSSEVEASQKAVSSWKHKEFNAPQCYAGSNILGSLCSNPTVTTGSAMVEVDQ